jgi:hypothetical protein
MIVIWLGAILFVCGVVYMAAATLSRGKLSDPHPAQAGPNEPTLEPTRRGLGFLGVGPNWPGLLMMAVGALMLLSGLVI